jgi:nitroreductase
MNVFDAVRTVLAVRTYQDKPVPAHVVRKIAEAAHLTATSRNDQPWHFVVVEERETLRKLGSLCRTGPFIKDAAMAVVVAIGDSQYAESDAGRAIQSMVMTAWEEGVGSVWAGWYGMDAVNEVVGIPPEFRVIAIVPFGYPDRKLGAGRKNRKPFDEIVSREKFGQPFA